VTMDTSVVDVQQRALRSFEHDFSPLSMAAFSMTAVSVTKGTIWSAAREYSSYMVLGSRVRAERSMGDGVLLVAGVLNVGAQQRRVQQVTTRRPLRCILSS